MVYALYITVTDVEELCMHYIPQLQM